MEPFDNDHELEQKNSAEVLRMNTVDVMDLGEEETDTSPNDFSTTDDFSLPQEHNVSHHTRDSPLLLV